MAFAVAVFVAGLAVIATERVHQTKVAMLGAALVVLAGVIDQEEAIAAVDFNTVGLLAGMMVIVRVTEATGVYNYLAIRAGQLSGGRPLRLFATLAAATGILSAFLPNLTIVLLIVPVTLLLADILDIDWMPLVLVEVLASNIGGAATLIGDPPNMLIAGATGLGFIDFFVNLAPIAIFVLVVVTAAMYLMYRGRLNVAPEARGEVMALDAARSIEDRSELRRTVPVLVLTVVAFFVHEPLGLEPATVALTGAAVMLLVSAQPVERALAEIEWPTLFFFIGLFVMVGALEESGAVRELADGFVSLTGGGRSAELAAITAGSAIGSAAIDNIPLTATMIPLVQDLQAGGLDPALWWALALGAAFGGNATLIAAAPNLAVAGMLQRAGKPISFSAFLRVGVPATILSVVLATCYVLVRYAWL